MTNATPALAVPSDYRRVGGNPAHPRPAFRRHFGREVSIASRCLPNCVNEWHRMEVLTCHLLWVNKYRRECQRATLSYAAPPAPAWPGMADDEPVETAIGRWEPGR